VGGRGGGWKGCKRGGRRGGDVLSQIPRFRC